VSPAILSLVALLLAIVLSMTSRINVGWLALTFAWLIGIYGDLRPDAIMSGFPATLFLTLTGVTLLFSIADTNGTLEALAQRAMGVARGRAGALPIILFAIACGLCSVGPGAVSTVALLAPLSMSLGDRAGVPPVLTALMVANGANAGNLSPFSSVGVIANGAMAKAGLAGHETLVWFANFAAHVVVAAAAYTWLSARGARQVRDVENASEPPVTPFSTSQRFTLITIGAWIFSVVGFNVSLGFAAFAAAAVLLLARTAEEGAAVRAMPWNIIMMVCGVSVLISVLEKTGGMDLFTALLATMATPASITGVIAFVTGAISTYSSTSGVVLPAFLPTIPGLVERLGGGDPLAIALAINVGSSLVDVSPLSTIGALAVAAVRDPTQSRVLFRQLMIWGVSMTLVGALLCQLFAGALARW
jgi:Na+/H+ antiporter NhaD/arsenite permease-like protein